MTTLKDITLEKDSYICLEAVAGEGAQAIVYKVQRNRDHALFALKVAKVWRNTKSETLLANTLITYNCERISKEIAFLQQLTEADSNFIVQLLDQGQVKMGGYDCPAFVMPWYETSLTKALHNPPKPNLQDRLQWIRQMVSALRYIHQQNDENGESLVHRDFKLDNLLLDSDKHIRLVDFGISKNLQRSTGPSATKMNYTPDCVAPEQVFIATPNTDGQKKVAIGTHTDMYALGLVIYYLITLEHPTAQQHFATNIEELIEKHIKLLNADGVGLLGKIEGLNQQDEATLKSAFINFLGGSPLAPNEAMDSGTLLDWDDDEEAEEAVSNSSAEHAQTSKTTQQLADDFVSFVKSMTDAEYVYRKDATSAGYWIENMIQRHDKIQETAKDTTGYQPVKNKNTAEKNEHTDSIYNVNHEEPDETSDSPFKVPRQPKKTSKAWLDTPAIAQLFSKKKVVAASVGALAIAVGAVNFFSPPSISTVLPEPIPTPISLIPVPNPIVTPPPELFAPSEKVQQAAWQALYNRSQDNDLAKQQLDLYEKQINEWINSDNKDDWIKAIPGLKRADWVGDINARLWMAYAFQEGRGVEVDWGESWDKYNQLAIDENNAIAQKQKQKLEKVAYEILLNDDSTTSQKALAYQVIEARAVSLSSKDSAHLWMAHRNTIGDGVEMDLERAQYWKNRYDGVLVESILKGSQN